MVLLIDREVSLSFVEPHVGRVNIVVFKESFLDVSKGYCLLFVNR